MKRKKYQSGGFDPKQVSKSAVMPKQALPPGGGKPKVLKPTIQVFNPPKAKTGGNTPKPKSVRPAPRPKAPVRPTPRPATPKTGGVTPRPNMGSVSRSAVMPKSESGTGPTSRLKSRPDRSGMLGAVMERSETPRLPSGRPGKRPLRPMGRSVGQGRRGRVRRNEGGITDFSSIFDMEKGK